jgi:CubicO group peptidase (beta-lactamase class C family)
LTEYVKHLKIEKPAGGQFQYKSVNSQLLGMVVERAVGKPLSAYLSEKIWQPLGMESNALWHVDDKKTEEVRGFCCLNAIARDYAKFGSLYLHNGNWQGQQVISAAFVAASTSINTLISNGFYKNQWWMNRRFKQFNDSIAAESERLKVNGSVFKSENKQYVVVPNKMKAYIAKGILGQYIYINPETNVVIVRLGKFWKFKGFAKAEGFIYDLARKI